MKKHKLYFCAQSGTTLVGKDQVVLRRLSPNSSHEPKLFDKISSIRIENSAAVKKYSRHFGKEKFDLYRNTLPPYIFDSDVIREIKVLEQSELLEALCILIPLFSGVNPMTKKGFILLVQDKKQLRSISDQLNRQLMEKLEDRFGENARVTLDHFKKEIWRKF